VLRQPGLGAAIRVVHQVAVGHPAAERHHQRPDDQVGGLALAHRPAHDAVVVEVDDPGQVELAVPAAELGDVGHPPLVGPLGGEVPLQQIRGRCRVGSAPPPLLAAVHADEPALGHDAGYPLAGVAAPPVRQLPRHSGRSVGAA
jgi:hypothetical protein